MIKFIIIVVVIYAIVVVIKDFVETHPIIGGTIVWGLISLVILKSIKILIIGEVVGLLLYKLKITKEENDEKKRLEEEHRRKAENAAKIEKWTEQGKGLAVDIDSIMMQAIDEFKQNYSGYYDYSDMPYGRAKAFISNFGKVSIDDEYYFFKPEKTHDVYAVRENGILIAKSGIYTMYECTDDKKNWKLRKSSLIFERIYKYDASSSCEVTLISKENNDFESGWINDLKAGYQYSGLDKIIDIVCKNKIPQFIKYNGLDVRLLQLDDVKEESGINMSMGGILSGAKARNDVYNEQKNYMNGSRGAGYAAEYGNITVDRVLGKKTINEAQNLDPSTGRQVKNGADRIINGEFIQTKYYNNFDNLYSEVFPGGKVRYLENGEPMKIEVPRDKYLEYCSKLQKKIDANQIEGLPSGSRADMILRKGYFSYNEAFNIARAGTIESLVVDMANGVITSAYPATISSVIVFAMSIWQGKDLKDAARASLEIGIQVVGRSMLIYTATMQLTRSEIGISFLNIQGINNPIMSMSKRLTAEIKSSKLAGTKLGEQLGLKTLTEKALVSNVVTAAVLFGPDMCKFFSGKISGKQLFKNSAVGAVGIGGGVLAGAVFGPAGMIFGGILGSMATKSVIDKYVEDDAVEMFQIYKEEFLEQVTVANLNKQEFQEICSCTLGDENLPKFLEIMHSKISPRHFVQEYISECLEKIYKTKQEITSSMIENGYIEFFNKRTIKVIEKYKDKLSGQVLSPGDTFEVETVRAQELLEAKVVEIVH